jgi:pyruvate dehydrogenase E1 component
VGGGRHAARGFLLGGTAGAPRSTAKACSTKTATATSCGPASIPNCVSYDPTFAYELAVIMQDGLRRMVADQETCTTTSR